MCVLSVRYYSLFGWYLFIIPQHQSTEQGLFNVGVGRWTVAQHPWRLQKCLGHHWHSTKRCTSADKPSPTGAGKSLGRQSSEAQRVLTSDHERYLRNKTNLHANVSPIIAHTCICLQGLISYLMFPSTNHFGFIISSASQIVQ